MNKRHDKESVFDGWPRQYNKKIQRIKKKVGTPLSLPKTHLRQDTIT